LAYLILFMMAVFAPSLITQDYLGIPETHVEELLIFLFGFAGIIIFMLYERLMEKKDKENKAMSDACEIAKKELVSSYQYIGSVNRQLEVLKQLANATSVSIYDKARLSKDLLKTLVSAAAVSFGGGPALLRFVNLDKLRTEREFVHPPQANGPLPFHVSNKDLKAVHEQGLVTRVTVGQTSLILVPSDHRNGEVKAFLILQEAADKISEYDPSVLKVFVNQAGMVYRALQRDADFYEERTPLAQLESVTQTARGEVD
jgi:hypothetical protein